MVERPILFNSEMVKAILEGRKIQTRRVVKPQPHYNKIGLLSFKNNCSLGCQFMVDFCPYGQPGDRLWLKENWRVGAWNESEGLIAVDYKTDGYCRREWLKVEDVDLFQRLWKQSTDDASKVFGMLERYDWKPGDSPCRWRPSIHMPRWASRITLEITNVRVERLQEITEEDAKKEGCVAESGEGCAFYPAKLAFELLWNTIKGKTYPWSSNPWVWVVEFRREEIRKESISLKEGNK